MTEGTELGWRRGPVREGWRERCEGQREIYVKKSFGLYPAIAQLPLIGQSVEFHREDAR